MKKYKKIIVSFFTVMLISVFVIPAMSASAAFPTTLSYSETSVMLGESRADVIEWRYKTVGDKVYRRKYNYSKKKWVGEWELCGYVEKIAEKNINNA